MPAKNADRNQAKTEANDLPRVNPTEALDDEKRRRCVRICMYVCVYEFMYAYAYAYVCACLNPRTMRCRVNALLVSCSWVWYDMVR